MNDEETLVFIDQIFRRKSLWDRRDDNYKNNTIKGDLWNEIAEVVEHPASLLKDKWSSLQSTYRKYRSNYKRSFVTGSGAEEIAYPTWFAYSAMRFLDSTTESGATQNTYYKDFNYPKLQKL
uniref:MADF domain-containing protein n=1 Tax=Anopheles maculatus TaxID=74869 RepID=A0A182T302_9DIPT